MHNDQQSLPPDCGREGGGDCTRRVNTETNYASCLGGVGELRILRNIKFKYVAVLFYVAIDLSVRL